MSCSWPTAETTGTGQAAIARTSRSSLNGSRSSKLPPPRASTIDVDAGARPRRPSAVDERGGRARPLDVRLGDEHVRGREAGGERGEHVALRGRVVAGDEADAAREQRKRPLALGGEEPLGGELALQPLERREVRAEAEPLDRQCAQPEVAARLEEVRPPVDVDALAVDQVEAQRVELAARHRHAEAGAVLGILQREEDALPALLAAKLGDLALDPDAWAGARATRRRRG